MDKQMAFAKRTINGLCRNLKSAAANQQRGEENTGGD